MKVEILRHPGNSDADRSAVQTSKGDFFTGEVVDLPEGEAGLIVAAGRGQESEKPVTVRKAAPEKK